MRHRRAWTMILVVALVSLLVGQLRSWQGSTSEPVRWQTRVLDPGTGGSLEVRGAPVLPLPASIELDHRQVLLGEKLFHDPQLSRDGTISCASCHNLKLGGTDQRVRSIGVGGAEGSINAPTVFNSAYPFRYFWDGREDSLEDQTDGPISNPFEMGIGWDEAIHRLQSSSDYPPLFHRAYDQGITQGTIKHALAQFERSLITPNSRFDQYLRGNRSALSEAEQEGYRRFQSYGCISCHQGRLLGGNMFQGFGIMGNYFEDRGGITSVDWGRYNVTGRERDRYVFKVPGLRNVELTAPYFHDGSAPTLEEAVVVMGRYQLGRLLTEEDVEVLVGFLKTLTGQFQGEPL